MLSRSVNFRGKLIPWDRHGNAYAAISFTNCMPRMTYLLLTDGLAEVLMEFDDEYSLNFSCCNPFDSSSFCGRHLRILELGEQSAITLGVRTDLVRLLLILSSVVLIACATAVTGPISFVAFLAGPIASKLVGMGTPNEFPAGLVGAVLVLGADLIGQLAFNTRFPVGVITGILGAPYLIILLIRMNQTGGSA